MIKGHYVKPLSYCPFNSTKGTIESKARRDVLVYIYALAYVNICVYKYRRRVCVEIYYVCTGAWY